MKSTNRDSFGTASKGGRDPSSADEWKEVSCTGSYPRSYTHLTHALIKIFEEAYIPATISHLEESTGQSLTVADRERMHDHYADHYMFSFYEHKGWSPLMIELQALDDNGKRVDYAGADMFQKQMIFDFFEDIEDALAGVPGVKPDMLTHTIKVQGPESFLRMIQALCAHNPQIPTSEAFYDAMSDYMASKDDDEKTQTIEDGVALVGMMKNALETEGESMLTDDELEAMPVRAHSLTELSLLYEAPRTLNTCPLFSMENLIAIVEEETGQTTFSNRRQPRPFMH